MGNLSERRKLLQKYPSMEQEFNKRRQQLRMLEKNFLKLGSCVDADWYE